MSSETNPTIEAGTTDLFMLSGIQLDWAVDALVDQSAISVYVPRHEQTISYMADDYARVTGRPGVGMVVPGPGMLNATAGLSTAYAYNSPTIFMVGQIHSQAIDKGYGNLYELANQSEVLWGLSKSHELVLQRDQIEGAVARAFSAAMSGRRRPAAIEIPYDMLMASDAPRALNVAVSAPTVLDRTAIDAAAAILDRAAFPVIYVGGGAVDAGVDVGPDPDRGPRGRNEQPLATVTAQAPRWRRGKDWTDDL